MPSDTEIPQPPTVTEDDVRRIVREEITRALARDPHSRRAALVASKGSLDWAYPPLILANAAAAEGLIAIDSPYFSLDDAAALAETCAAALGLGFHAKAAIHPKQIAVINEHFSPTPAEVERATTILELSDGGASAIDGKMIDMAILRWARRIVPPPA